MEGLSEAQLSSFGSQHPGAMAELSLVCPEVLGSPTSLPA